MAFPSSGFSVSKLNWPKQHLPIGREGCYLLSEADRETGGRVSDPVVKTGGHHMGFKLGSAWQRSGVLRPVELWYDETHQQQQVQQVDGGIDG